MADHQQPFSGSQVSLNDGDTCLHKLQVLRLLVGAHLFLHLLQMIGVPLLNCVPLFLVFNSELGNPLLELQCLSDGDSLLGLTSSHLGCDLLILEQFCLHLLGLLVGCLLFRNLVDLLVSLFKVAIDIFDEVVCAMLRGKLVLHQADGLLVLGTELVRPVLLGCVHVRKYVVIAEI